MTWLSPWPEPGRPPPERLASICWRRQCHCHLHCGSLSPGLGRTLPAAPPPLGSAWDTKLSPAGRRAAVTRAPPPVPVGRALRPGIGLHGRESGRPTLRAGPCRRSGAGPQHRFSLSGWGARRAGSSHACVLGPPEAQRGQGPGPASRVGWLGVGGRGGFRLTSPGPRRLDWGASPPPAPVCRRARTLLRVVLTGTLLP